MKWLTKLKPIFTVKQFERLSNIFDNLGQGFFVAAVLSPMILGFDKVDFYLVMGGASMVISCWLVSLWLARKSEE